MPEVARRCKLRIYNKLMNYAQVGYAVRTGLIGSRMAGSSRERTMAHEAGEAVARVRRERGAGMSVTL